MIKTLERIFKQDKTKFVIPKGVQDMIPISTIWPDGVFLVGKNKYSKTFKFTDINYASASRPDKEAIFLQYASIINAFDSGATSKITINNRRMNQRDFEREMLLAMKEDGLDIYRKELNDLLLDKAMGGNGIVQDKYVTVSIQKKSVEEARTYFARVGADLTAHYARLGSKCAAMDATERLRCLHDFYRSGEETSFRFDMSETMRKGHSFKDFICPDTFEFERDCFRMGDKYGRVFYLKEYASYIKDSFVDELTSFSRNMMLSIDVIPVPTDEAVREVENRLLGVETNITNWQRRQNSNNNFSAVIPYDMEQQRKESKEFLDDLTTRDQRMCFAVITIVLTADTKEQLDADTESIFTIARKNLCQLAVLKYQQADGLNTALPIGVRRINAVRTLTTESLAVFMPFKVQEILDKDGIYFGENAISHNLLMCNKATLLNQSAFLLGVPGSGKSFAAKMMLAFIILMTDDEVIICDPENEYGELIKALGGVVINIAPGSRDHINAMDMDAEYGDGRNPVIDKSEFVLSLFEQVDKDGIGAREKSIIDRCTAAVYADAKETGKVVTLHDLRAKLMEQPEKEGASLALALELLTDGSLDVFAYPTNVDTSNRIICFNINGLGKQLKPTGALVVTDFSTNRVAHNWRRGKRTHLFYDEFHVLYENDYSGAFLNSAWRRFRKRNAFPTGITQNVEYLLDSVLASTMLSNSEFIVMLNQAASDREKLAKLLNISNEQMSYITDTDAGSGLLKYGSSLVPFVNRFPTNTRLYRLMTTKPNEKLTS